MKTKPLDLTQFCTPDSIHFSFDRPWRDGSHVYASDGKILVCVDAVLLPDWTPPVGQVPQGLDLLLAPVSKIRKWRRLAPVADCAACNNTGRVLETCDACSDDGPTRDCNICDGTGKIETSEYCRKCIVVFERNVLQAKYVRKLSALPDIHIGVSPKGHFGRVYFKFAGGRAVLSALRGTSEWLRL